MADNIDKINRDKIATPNKLYRDKSGNIYKGTANKRLKLIGSDDYTTSDLVNLINSLLGQINSIQTYKSTGSVSFDLGDLPILDKEIEIVLPIEFGDLMFFVSNSIEYPVSISYEIIATNRIRLVVSSNTFISGVLKFNYIII